MLVWLDKCSTFAKMEYCMRLIAVVVVVVVVGGGYGCGI
jgi:hypothetical protein